MYRRAAGIRRPMEGPVGGGGGGGGAGGGGTRSRTEKDKKTWELPKRRAGWRMSPRWLPTGDGAG